eukprot:CAMPEP_0184482626 /NCGR_PEP_ID=MMETSP0113_2-20130426/4204_1 /TAXON_ID=91329 /ORGANISM="Norrisiella sphaerica, Strain BC52" /LENGTH=124 /DNA_ID=CAMNT_0026862473 /DNA_START=263 /DNA_END=637 /DNA_ORIENTATION=-
MKCEGDVQIFSSPDNPNRLYWKSSFQNPAHMVWGIPSSPWVETKRDKLCQLLQDNYGQIRSELDRVLEARKEQEDLLSKVGSRDGEAGLVASGTWRDYILLDDGGGTSIGKYSPEALCPHTVKV